MCFFLSCFIFPYKNKLLAQGVSVSHMSSQLLKMEAHTWPGSAGSLFESFVLQILISAENWGNK